MELKISIMLILFAVVLVLGKKEKDDVQSINIHQSIGGTPISMDSIKKIKTARNGIIQRYKKKTYDPPENDEFTNDKNKMNDKPQIRHRMSINTDATTGNLKQNKREAPCISEKENQARSVNFSSRKENGAHSVSSIMESLNIGTNSITYSSDPNIILLLGLSGVGKSTFAQYIAGDNSNLISVAKKDFNCKKTNTFYIDDTRNKIGHGAFLSHTELPDLVFDPETNTTIYDCPGFSDTRDPDHDISGAYFIKAISDRAKALKLVFVVNYNSVISGASRKEFMELAKHATNMIENISKFNESIALVATKIKDSNSDDQRITDIASFLQEIKSELININKEPKVQTFIDILLTTDASNDQIYPRIGLMPKFETEGPLISMPAVQAQKQKLRNIIHNNIKYTQCDVSDIKPTISSESVIYINGLVKEVTKQTWLNMNNVVQKVQTFYDDLIYNMQEKIHCFSYENCTVNMDRSQAEQFLTQLDRGSKIISDVVKQTENITDLEKLSEFILTSKIISEANLSQEVTSSFSTQLRYLKFLFTLQKPNGSLSLNEWNALSENLKNHLKLSRINFESNICNVADRIKIKIVSINNNIMNEILKNFSHLPENILDDKKLSLMLNSGYFQLKEIHAETNDLNDTYKCINQIKKAVEYFNFTHTDIESIDDVLQKTSKLGDNFSFIQIFECQSIKYSLECTERINHVISHLDELNTWYFSLVRLNQSISKCSTLKKISPYEISNMVVDGYIGKRVKEVDFKFFLHKVYSPSIYDLEYSNFENIKLDQFKINNLKKLSTMIYGYQLTHKNCSFHNSTTNTTSMLSMSDLYTTSGFINELLAIEHWFRKLHEKISFIEIYQSFLNRIVQHVKKFENDKTYLQNNKILQYLYAVAANKLHNLKYNFDKFSIELDIIGYFTRVEDHIGEYKKALREVNINKYEKKYEATTETIVTATIKFVENDIQPALNENIKNINDNINVLVNEVINHRKNVESEISSLEKSKSQLENQLVLKSIFGVLQVVGAGLAILGPVGATVGAGISMTSGVATSFIPNADNVIPTQLPPSVSKSITKISDHAKNYGLFFDKKLQSVKQELDGALKNFNANELQIIQNSTALIQHKINKISSQIKVFEVGSVTSLENEFINSVTKEIQIINNEKKSLEKDYADEVRKANNLDRVTLNKLHDMSLEIKRLSAKSDEISKNEITRLKKEQENRIIEITQLNNEAEAITNDQKSLKSQANEFSKERKKLLKDYAEELEGGGSYNPEYLDKKAELLKKIDDLSNKEKTVLKGLRDEKKVKYDNHVKTLNNIQNVISMSEAVFNVYSQVRNDQNKIDKVESQLGNAIKKIKDLKQYQISIYKTLIPLTQQLESISTDSGKHLSDKSHASLDITKWKLRNAITDIQNQVLDMTNGFKAQGQFKNCIDKVHYGIQTMIQMYDRIQNEKERKQLANYIADISRSEKMTNDSKMNADIDQLELMLKSSIVLQEYDQAISAFKQYVFPFAESHLIDFSLMYKFNNVTDLIGTSIEQIKRLREQLVHSKGSLNSKSYSKDIHIDKFKLSKKISTVEPYYTWKHELYRNEILKLLQGQEITLEADIVQGIERHALMFNDIGVYFKLENATMQIEFDKLLSSVQINMTHLGDSYYRCGNKTYIMTQPPQTFKHNVMPDDNMEFTSGNTVYTTLISYPAILSPFTMWKLNIFSFNKFEFGQFAKYTNQSIDLRLVGTGRFIHPAPVECNSNLEKHYKLAGIIS